MEQMHSNLILRFKTNSLETSFSKWKISVAFWSSVNNQLCKHLTFNVKCRLLLNSNKKCRKATYVQIGDEIYYATLPCVIAGEMICKGNALADEHRKQSYSIKTHNLDT